MSRRASESIALTGPTATAQDDKPKSRRSAQSVALTGDGGALLNMPPSAPVPPDRQTVADGTASAVDTGYSSFADFIGDMGSRAKIGVTRGLQAIPQIPVGLWNLAVRAQPSNLVSAVLPDDSSVGKFYRGMHDSMLLDQPDLVREFADTGDRLIDGTQNRMSVTAAAQRDAEEKVQGFVDTAKLYLSNPSMISGATIESLAQAGVTAGVPGGVGGQLFAQGAMAGAAADRETQNAIRAMTPERVSQFEDVAKYAELHGMTPEEAVAAIARERGAQAFAGSAVLNAMLPKVIPGATAVERAMARAGGADVLPTQAGRFTNLLVGGVGEAGGEAIAEGGETLQQNILTDVRDPLTGQQTPFAGVSKASAIGGLTGLAMGSATGAMDGKPKAKDKGGAGNGTDAPAPDATVINPPDDPALDPISTADITASASAEVARIEGLGDKASAEEKQIADFLRANKKRPGVLARAAGYRLDDTEAKAKAAETAAQAERSAGEAMRVERAKSEVLNVQAAQAGGKATAAGASPVAPAPAQSAPDLTARFDSVRGKTRPELVAAVMAAATPDARADAAANIAAFDALRAREAAEAQKAEKDAAKSRSAEAATIPLIQPGEPVQVAPPGQDGSAITMQNRNRDRAASVLQMQGIANNPDPQRLSVSRDPATGAPMVYIGGDASPAVLDSDMGATDTVTMANGRKVPFRYAVVEADSVQASHTVDGAGVPEYAAPLQPGQVRALNNGRTAGVQSAFSRGTADAYVGGIVADSALHGVSEAAIRSKRKPMLVRVYSESDNTGDMGAESNASQALGLSASEQAATDARALPSLDMLRVGEDGDLFGAGNRDFVRAWLSAMGQNEAAKLASASGEPTRQMADRLKAAIFHAAYGADRLTAAMAEDASPEMRNVLSALTIAAPKFAALDKAGPFGDVASVVADAIELIRDSKARGIAIGSVSDMFSPRAGAVDELARRIDSRSRAPRKLGELLAELARFVSAEQAAAQTTDMFGKPVVTYDDAINAWDRLNEQQNADANANANAGQSAGLFDANGRGATVGGGAPAPGAVQPADNVGGAGSNRVENGRGTNASRQSEGVKNDPPSAQRRSAEQPSGIPAGLRAEQTDESRRLAKRFNGWLERLGRGAEQVRFREVTAASLPDALNRAFRAIEQATGTRIVVVRNLTPDVEKFNGLTFRDGTIYVDESSDRPATLVAVHEWVHQLQRDAPELYARLEQEVMRQGDLPAWAERMRAEGNRADESGVAEELTADAVADALTDPVFLRGLASRDVGLFRQVADSILRFLDSMLAKIKDRGTNAYLSDVQAFRDVLAGVLSAAQADRNPESKPDQETAPDTITVDGVERPRTNSNGQPKNERDYNAEAPRHPYTDDRQLQLFLDNGPVESQAGQRGEAAQRAAVAAVDDLRSTETILGLALSRDYAARQRVSLVGQKVSSVEDLAVLAQVYRDPRFETLRVVFVNDSGKVVSQVGLTSRLPAAAPGIMGSDLDAYLGPLMAAARNRGASGYYMLHNHPSGSAKTSRADEVLTNAYAERTFGTDMQFRGHVVIDTNEYSVINGRGESTLLKKDFGQPAPYRAQEWADVKITGPADVMAMAKRLQVDEGAVTLIHTDSQFNVKAISTIPTEATIGDQQQVRRQVVKASLKVQGSQVFAVSRNSAALLRINGLIRDGIHVSKSGQVRSLASDGLVAGSSPFPESRRTRLSPDTSPEFAYLRHGAQQTPMQRVAEPGMDQTQTPEFKRWFGDSKVVDAEGKPLVVYHGTASDFDAFDNSKTGANDRGLWGRGHYFSASLDNANSYALRQGEGARVIPAYVSIKNPLILKTGSDLVTRLPDGTNTRELIGENLDGSKIKQLALDGGHDGVIQIRPNGQIGDLVAYRPEQIKSATGNNGEFSPDDARITFQRRTAAEVRFDALQGRMFTLAKLQAMGFRAGSQGWNYRANDWDEDGVRGLLKQARANLQDKFYALAEAQGDIAAAVGAVVDDAQNAYRLENLAHGRTGDRMEKLEGTILQPLSKLMRDAGLSMDVLEDYLLARHAPERNRRIAAINDDMPDGGSGITTADALAILSGAKPGVYSGKLLDKDTLATLTKAAALVDRMREQTINAMVESGSLSDAQAKALRDAFKYYVPLRGKGETDELGGTDNSRSGGAGRIDYRGPRVRRALGRGEGNLARDIVAEMVGDAQRAIVAAELAKVRVALLRLAMANPNPDAWTVAPVDLEYRFSEATGEVYLAPKGQFEMAQDSLLIPLDGVTYRLKIEHPQLREALLNLGTVDTSLFTKTFGIINRWQSATMTRYNPAFVAINLIRDVGFALPTVASQHGAKTALDVLANYGPAMASTWRDVRDGKPGDASVPDAKKRMIDWAREYAEAGGRTSIMRYDDVETISKKQRRAMQTLSQLWSQGWGGKAAASAEAVKRAVGPLAEVIDAANDSVENAVRLSLYVSLRKQGWSREAAAEASKNVTVNFNRKGKWATHLNAIFLFWNAAVQGSHAVMKALSDKRVVGGLTALGALQGMFAMSMLGMDDDDDGVSLWDSIPAYRKFNAFIVPAPWSDDGYFAVPMPYGFNAFTFLGGRSVQWARDAARDERGAHASFLGDVGSGLIRSFSPVPLDQGPSGLAGNVAGIALGIAANTDDLGRPITQETYGRKVPLSTTGRYTTAEPFKVAATVLNRLGGGSDDEVPVFMPSVTDVSPDMLAHIWREATGGIGGLLSKGAASIEGVAAGRFDSVSETLANAPITSSFGIVASADRAVADRYYRQKENLELIHGRARRAVADALDANGGDQSALARDWPAVRDALGPMAAGLELVRYKRSGKRDDGSRYVAGEIQFTTLAGRRVPKLEAAEGSPMHAYKVAQDAVKEHGDAIRQAYVSDMPSAERERVMREHRTARREAQQAMLRAIRNAQRAAQ